MPYPYHKITEEDMAHLIRTVSRDRVCIGDEIPKEYYHDEMPEYGWHQPDIYIEVLSKEEVSAVMAYAHEHNIPVTARGAGTGLAGGATCKYGGIMLSLMRMNHIENVDTQNLTITAESGALLTDVAEKAAEAGLFYPPDPGERTASIGGTVITNAGGMRAVRYGVTRDYVRCVEAVLPDGSIVEFSSNVAKNTTGYDIKDLIIGSEGTLCIVTKVTLRLIPAPNCTRTLVMTFSSIEPCIETVPKLLQTPYVPTAIEFLERELTDIVDRRLNKPFPVQEGSDFLIVMYDGSSTDEVDTACEMACEIAMDMDAIDVKICDSPERIGSVWSARAAILEGMKADSDAQEECDVVVPRARIADFVKAAQEIGRKYKIRVIVCGHAGDGNIHTEMLRNNLSDEEWKSNTLSCLKELYAKSKELGGQLSGEHGIGNGRLEFLEDFIGSRMYQLYQSVKLAFDDKLILNPGKIIEYK
ncbi:FAD-binding oxidoreductase [Ruminococcus sp. OA3]|uniref:FAD-binding oxidoreductase n=1 Tax=Ruminococcus sp. OA3 TaxID=2914164 RepID=UPI001F063C75|nr:FAD-binding oxidoreductase [Ruminococcus sp. OA3]MCH1981308.1 FAD-binding oxidoreductase [Ruminococcus sp. OA3]